MSKALTAWIEGIGFLAPGLPDWPTARAVLRGEQAYANAPSVLPAPAILPPAERRRASRVVKLTLAVGLEAAAHAGADVAQLATVFSGQPRPRQKIGIVGMMRTRARIAVAEFDKRADFVIWDYDSSQDELSAMNHCDIVFMHINHSSHTTKYKLNAIKANVVNVCGAATSLRDAVARYLAE